MLTRGDPKVDGGRRTYSARHLVELVGSTRSPAQIYKERETDVPPVVQAQDALSEKLGAAATQEGVALDVQRLTILWSDSVGVGAQRPATE